MLLHTMAAAVLIAGLAGAWQAVAVPPAGRDALRSAASEGGEGGRHDD
jgi:hypothetical protein